MVNQSQSPGPRSDHRTNPSVVVIGAGMTGLLLVIKLRERGIRNITLLEKADTFGGTWRENTYPGIACDVPSHAYTYSFEPNPDWSHHFPPGREIYEYFEKVFYKYGINYCTRFNEAVTRCEFDDGRERWRVGTSQGNTYEADLVFCATGILHHPKLPDIPGLDAFEGPAFHSARWDHTVELQGKRIGVIGTGSSATQIVVELVEIPGARVSVFQRTPQWIVRMDDRAFSEYEKRRFRKQPWRIKLIRRLSALVYSQGTAALTNDDWWHRQVHKLTSWNARRYIRASVKDPVLRAKLTPDYEFGCKRVVINGKFYDAMQQPNARLVTDAIQRVETNGILTRDASGKETLHELDLIVMATGFDPTAYMRPMRFTGRHGLTIEQAWQEKISAYCSMCIPGFPNFFLMLGPNSPIGNQSVIEISEHQSDYAMQLVRQWQSGALPVIEARPEALDRWRAMIKNKMKRTVWVSGCQSWYLDAEGDSIAWPDSWNNWLKQMESPVISDFVTGRPGD